MDFVRFGATGLKVSRICLGCMSYGARSERWQWVLSEEQSRPFIKRALELGINFFDTADIYSNGASEEILGRALSDFTDRDQVVIATKLFGKTGVGVNDGGLSRKHIFNAVNASLKRLGTDYIDLYQIHYWDSETPIEETLEALNDIVRSGKVRYIGACSMFAWQFSKALYTSDLHGWARFVSMQPHYNLAYREEEREMLPLCRDQHVAVIPYSPLARGLLAGNRKEGGGTERAQKDAWGKRMYAGENDAVVADRVSQVAKEHGLPNAQIAIAWLLSKNVVTAPILGATQLKHLEDAVAALSIHLTEEEIVSLEQLYQPHPVMGIA